MRLSIVFFNGRVLETDTGEWTLIDSGGEADIYEAKLAGSKYIVKVFTEKQTALAKPIERVSEMLSRLVRLRHRCGGLPESLMTRGFPVGIGALQDSAVMVFRYVEEFKTIADVLNSVDELERYLAVNNISARASMAYDVLKATACLELADIAHIDLTTVNTAYGIVGRKRWVYLYDLETAAVMNTAEYPLTVIPARDAHYMPVDSLRAIGINIEAPDPSELPLVMIPSRMKPSYLSWVLWTSIWYSLQLVSYIYTGLSLFQGLPSISIDEWVNVVEYEKEHGYEYTWPPIAMRELGLLEGEEYRELRNIWSMMGRKLVEAIYRVFVVDLAEKRGKPSITLSWIAGIT